MSILLCALMEMSNQLGGEERTYVYARRAIRTLNSRDLPLPLPFQHPERAW